MGFVPHQKVASVCSQQSSRGKMGSSSSKEPCSRASSDSFETPGTPGWTYHNPNPTQPEEVPEKDDEIVLMSVVYFEGVHRFVDHQTHNGYTIRTEKHGQGEVSWFYEPCMGRIRNASFFCATYYPAKEGPTIGMLRKKSISYHGDYNIASNNCWNYAASQVNQWPGGRALDFMEYFVERFRNRSYEAVPRAGVEIEIVKESRIYVESFHWFVDHETLSGRIIRTEKVNSNVLWDDDPEKARCILAGKEGGTSYPFGLGLGPTIGELKRRSQSHHRHVSSNNSWNYAESQVTGWHVGWQWTRKVTVRCAWAEFSKLIPSRPQWLGRCEFVLRSGSSSTPEGTSSESHGPAWHLCEGEFLLNHDAAAKRSFAVKEAKVWL